MDSVNHPHADDSAFVALLTETQMPLRLYVRALMPGDPSVGDVIQHANAKLWEKRQEFEPGTNFKAWAIAIARFEVLNHRKRQARDARLQFSSELEEIVTSEMVQLDDDLAERQAALRECMKSLKPASRELLLRRYESREPLSDFANRVGRSLGGVKVTLHRLRTSLAQCIERKMISMGEPE
jgi:RNA polymerase sigma-70 factor (ECF subfamily)